MASSNKMLTHDLRQEGQDNRLVTFKASANDEANQTIIKSYGFELDKSYPEDKFATSFKNMDAVFDNMLKIQKTL